MMPLSRDRQKVKIIQQKMKKCKEESKLQINQNFFFFLTIFEEWH